MYHIGLHVKYPLFLPHFNKNSSFRHIFRKIVIYQISWKYLMFSWIRALQYDSYRNSQQDATVYQSLLFHVYMKLNMFRATHRPSSGAQNCTSSLWFCIRKRLLDVEFAGRWQRPANSTSDNLLLMQNQRLLVQFWAPDDGRCVARIMLNFI